MLTQYELKSNLDYCQSSVLFTWKINKGNRYIKGCVAGHKSTNPDGKTYVKIGINGVTYLAHRLAWLYMFNELPNEIDHINGDGSDNRASNIRNTTPSQSQRNKRIPKTNKSGVIGVWYSEKRKKWICRITNNDKRIYLGAFDNLFDAACARLSAENTYGYHGNHGSIRSL